MAEELTPRDAPFPPLRYVLPGLVLPPLAWLLQMVMAETLAAQSCYPFNQPLSAPVVPWMRPALVVISALCFVVGGLGSVIAWRNLRRIGSKQVGALSGAPRTRAELAGFLSRVAAMCSVLFLFALVATDVALAIVSPCRWW
ncbi:hypothetical protein [Paraburkholderia sp. BCC1876]|uniref:hypothetical protein n=1 Tax=Paraburkholderia sp. BCC1876 TaxID=2676303 RepID=UPI00159182ED|nr:hypothetical protein [Paraburkholderia sp. BCC1876]